MISICGCCLILGVLVFLGFGVIFGFRFLELDFLFRVGFFVGYRLPGGYTVECFWVDFYMWLLFDFGCFRDFGYLGWFGGF